MLTQRQYLASELRDNLVFILNSPVLKYVLYDVVSVLIFHQHFCVLLNKSRERIIYVYVCHYVCCVRFCSGCGGETINNKRAGILVVILIMVYDAYNTF